MKNISWAAPNARSHNRSVVTLLDSSEQFEWGNPGFLARKVISDVSGVLQCERPEVRVEGFRPMQ